MDRTVFKSELRLSAAAHRKEVLAVLFTLALDDRKVADLGTFSGVLT